VPDVRRAEGGAEVRFFSVLFSRTGLAIAAYILIGVFVNTAPPHLPASPASIAGLHSWLQWAISVLFWPLGLWTPPFTTGKWH
jgi:hypothetical protein